MKALPLRLRTHPWLMGLLALIVVAAAGLGTYFGTRSDGAAAAAVSTTTQTVSTGTVKQSVSATGTLAPAVQDDLSFSVSGQVTTVAVSEGQRVTKGQTLATIDSASLSAAVASAKAAVANDQAKVDADATNSASDTQTAADKAALTAAQNQLTSAEKQLAGAALTSPINGVVATLDLTVGQSVSGSGGSSSSGSASTGGGSTGGGSAGSSASSGSSSSAQILVISTDSWIVSASIDATSVGLIKTGDQAQLTVDGSSGTVYGTVESVALVSSSTSGTASYPVVIAVTGSPSGLHDGANVTAALIYKQVSDVVVIPSTAIHRTSSGGEYVEQVKNGKTVRTNVQVGLSAGGQVQIKSGLLVGDKIVVPQVIRSGRSGGGAGATPGGGNFTFPAGGLPGGGSGGGFGGGSGGGGG